MPETSVSDRNAYDLIVVGGGPGGSTVSTFVASQNHRVLLLERDRFPRYQIGESLLPSTVHGICRLLGVGDELERANFVLKNGGCFRWGTNPKPWSFSFREHPALGPKSGFAFQVERSKFDHILLENARQKGVDVRERCAVTGLIRASGRVAGVSYTDESGGRHEASARFVVDASGNQSSLYRHAGERVFSRFFRNVALFCYFENGKRLPPPNSGNIFCAAFRNGWFWYIPLSPNLTSVGAVISVEHADELRGGHESAMRGFIEGCPEIKDLLSSATRITDGEYGRFRVRKDYSYCNSSFCSPGLLLVGDAACFIDPVFSSGVHLATYAALLAARTVNTCLAPGKTIAEERCAAEFERRYRREFGNFYKFLVTFYDMQQTEDSYFWHARKILNSEERANTAFLRLVAGISSSEGFFGSVEGVSDRIDQATQEAAGRDTRDNWGPERFIDGFYTERNQIAAQAALGAQRPGDTPIFGDGLAPSDDGFHWKEAT